MRSYIGFLLSRFKWAKSGIWGHVGNIALVVGFVLAILAWAFPDWAKQHVSERMSAFALGVIPLLSGASVFLFRWLFLSSFFVHKTDVNRIRELEDRLTPRITASCSDDEQCKLKGSQTNLPHFRVRIYLSGDQIAQRVTATVVGIRENGGRLPVTEPVKLSWHSAGIELPLL